jgi:hypothetical protein
MNTPAPLLAGLTNRIAPTLFFRAEDRFGQ